MSKDTARQIINVLAAAVALAVNVLANALPFNGQTTGEISDRFQVYFVPAGYVFSIWGILYIGWIAFAVYQFLPAQRQSPRLRNLGYLFALSCALNAVWLFFWHYNYFGLTVVIMLILLGTLIIAYLELNVGRKPVGAAEKWCVDIPFSLYLGWITVAAVANVTDYLYFIGWNGLGVSPQTWAAIMLGVACLIGLAMALTRRDSAYLFVLVWAFVGIALKQADALLVAYSAWSASAFALLLAVYSLVQRRQPAG